MPWYNLSFFFFFGNLEYIYYLSLSKISEYPSKVETLNADYEKIQKANNKLQKLCDSLEDDKLYLQGELERLSKDAELR